MSGDEGFSEEAKRNLIKMEAGEWCRAVHIGLNMGLPLFLAKLRCRYVSQIIEPINRDCSDLCRRASEAENIEQFIETCKASTVQWYKMQEQEKRRLISQTGIV